MSGGTSKAGGIFLYRLTCRVVRFLLWPFFRAEVKFVHPWPSDSRIVVIGNHVSYLDPAYHCIFLPPRLTFAIQARVSGRLWVRPFLRVCNALPVSPERAHSVKILAREAAAGQAVCLFPEGRISPSNALQFTYSGPALVARVAKATLVPVTILGAENTFFALAPETCPRRWFQKIHLVTGKPVSWEVFSGIDAESIPRKLFSILFDARVEAIESVFTPASFIAARLRSQGGASAYWNLDGERFSFRVVRKLLRGNRRGGSTDTDWGQALLRTGEKLRRGEKGEQPLLRSLARMESVFDLGPRDRVLCLPLDSNRRGWEIAGVLFPVIRGATFLEPHLSFRGTADRIYRHDATWLIGSPTELQALAKVARPHELQSLRRILCVSAEEPDPEVLRAVTLALGLRPFWLRIEENSEEVHPHAFMLPPA